MLKRSIQKRTFKINYNFTLKISAYLKLWTDFYIRCCFGRTIPSYVAKEKNNNKKSSLPKHKLLKPEFIWALMWETCLRGLLTTKEQTGHRLCYLLFRKYHNLNLLQVKNFNSLASLFSWAVWLESLCLKPRRQVLSHWGRYKSVTNKWYKLACAPITQISLRIWVVRSVFVARSMGSQGSQHFFRWFWFLVWFSMS